MKQCNHVDRVSLHPSIRIGGFAIGQCEREVLPGMVVCAWHATPDAVTIAIRDMRAERDEAITEAEARRLDFVQGLHISAVHSAKGFRRERDDARAEVERLRAERNHAIVACRAMVDAEHHRFDSATYDEKYRSALRLLESVAVRFDAADAEEKP